MAGYTRQDSNDNIATGKVINASDFDNEYNAIEGAFSNSSGHKHDGTGGEGARIIVIGSSGQVSTDSTTLFTTSNAAVGLGKAGNVWKDLFVDNIKIDGNTITSENTNGNIVLTPNGDGLVTIADGDLQFGSTPITATGDELNIMDGSVTTQATVTLAAGDGVVISDGDVMKQALVSDFSVYTASSTQTLTNKTIDANGTGNSITNIEVADLAGSAVVTESEGIGSNDNDTTLPTSAAVKDYVDTQLTAEDLDGTADSGTFAVDLDSQALAVTGGTGIDTSASGQAVTVAIDSTVATLAGSQALTNKTLTSPVINTGVSGTAIDTDLASVSGSDDTLASAKAIKAYVDAQNTAQDLDIIGDSGGALSIDLDAHTLDIAGGAGIATSGSGQTITVAINNTVATLTGTQTLTNKTLTTPKIQYIHDATHDNRIVSIVSNSGSSASQSYLEILAGATATEPVTLKAQATGSNTVAGGIRFHDVQAATSEQSSADFLQYLLPKAFGYIERINNSGSFNSIIGTTHTVNLDTGAVHLLQLGNNTITLTYAKQPSTTDFSADASFGFSIIVKQDGTGGRAITWPGTVKWAGGAAPTLTGTANSIDVFTFITYDQGTTYHGFTAGLNLS